MKNDVNQKNQDAQTLLNQIVVDYRKEQQRNRIWRWVKRVIILILIAVLYLKYASLIEEDNLESEKPHVGLIDLKGSILDNENGNSENFTKAMQSAYKKTGLKALIIRINSPGGSPVQADEIFNTIQFYRKAHPEIKVYAVCTDICASGAYFVASAAQEIYANESSMVGSIGVIYSGFGFVDALQKLGVTRRIQTAGVNKAMMDAFSPVNPEAERRLQGMLGEVHQAFIKKVKLGRAKRLSNNPELFSGLVWTGKKALELGLIDGFASSDQLVRDTIKLDSIIDYTFKQSVLERVSKGVGTAMAMRFSEAFGVASGIKVQL